MHCVPSILCVWPPQKLQQVDLTIGLHDLTLRHIADTRPGHLALTLLWNRLPKVPSGLLRAVASCCAVLRRMTDSQIGSPRHSADDTRRARSVTRDTAR